VIVEVDAWVASAQKTKAWLAEQRTGGWPDETIEEARRVHVRQGGVCVNRSSRVERAGV
jgi:hypothetical protein